ncbi:MAG: hypothetical protein V4496_05745 [Pseudomonadota bacterium]
MKLADKVLVLLSEHPNTVMPSQLLITQLDHLVEEHVRNKYHHIRDIEEHSIKEHLLEAMMTLAFGKKQEPLHILLNYCFAKHPDLIAYFHCKDPIEAQDTDKFPDYIGETLLMSHALCANNDRVAELLAQGANENIAAFSYLMTGNMEEVRKLKPTTSSTDIIVLALWVWTSYGLATMPTLAFLGTLIKDTNAVMSALSPDFQIMIGLSDERHIDAFPPIGDVYFNHARGTSRLLQIALSHVARQEKTRILAKIAAEQAQITAENSKTNHLETQKNPSDAVVSITRNSIFAKQEEKAAPAHLFYAKGRNFKVL